jgi:preprotein translocase subunit SecE
MSVKVKDFLSNVNAELRKVTWPSKKDTYGSTLVVIIVVLICAVFLGGVDVVLSRLIRLILG